MKVGIDLSSTNTGLVILSDDNKLIFHGNFQLWDSDRFVIASKISEMIDYIELKNPFHKFIMMGIELADFKNANITNRFNLLAGMIISELSKMKAPEPIGNDLYLYLVDPLKIFNSNEWQRFLLEHYEKNVSLEEETETKICYDDGLEYEKVIIHQYYVIRNLPFLSTQIRIEKDERKLRKTLARCFAKEHLNNHIDYDDNWTEDECDAYCIAYFLEKLRDRTQMHQEVKAKKVQAKKSKLAEKNEQIKKWRKENKLRQIQNKYLNILASGKKLTKAQDRALDNAIKELKELE